ncbi:MAG: LamG-like jellyroll fold domain-containing protein, partial [Kiritimatiellota bacterium]|nr:LamG-like jellyroll fold domain-containing protein [Kiritimatiellota bacterium]
DVLRVDLGAQVFGRGSTAFIRDQSDYGNHLYANCVFVAVAAGENPGKFIMEYDGRRGMIFGPGGGGKHGGGGELLSFDSFSLNSPALGNSVTLEAEIFIPKQPIGCENGILGKGSFDISLDSDGRILFRLWVMEKDKRRRLVLRSDEPLSAGKWHKIRAGFDGRTARLLLDGKLAASEEAAAGARILPAMGAKSPGAVAGFYFSQPQVTDRKNLVIATVRIANGWSGDR